MPYFLWTDDLSTGDKELDADHRRLVAVINAMISSMEDGSSTSTLVSYLANVIAYASDHFDREKSKMNQIDSSETQAHIDDHKILLSEAEEIKRQIESGASINQGELYSFLKTWLRRHIATFDTRMVKTPQLPAAISEPQVNQREKG